MKTDLATIVIARNSFKVSVPLKIKPVLLIVRGSEGNTLLANKAGYAALSQGMNVNEALKTDERVYLFFDGTGSDFCSFTHIPMHKLRRPICPPLARWMIERRVQYARLTNTLA